MRLLRPGDEAARELPAPRLTPFPVFGAGRPCYTLSSAPTGQKGRAIVSSIFEEAFERFTGDLASGGAEEIPCHERWVEVPPGVAAPGVFVRGGREVGFWLKLVSHSVRQETSILQKAMGKRGEMNVGRGSAMVRDAIRCVADSVERLTTDDPEDNDAARDARATPLTKAKREWLWKALSQRGRNLMAAEYDKLTEPATADEEGNG